MTNTNSNYTEEQISEVIQHNGIVEDYKKAINLGVEHKTIVKFYKDLGRSYNYKPNLYLYLNYLHDNKGMEYIVFIIKYIRSLKSNDWRELEELFAPPTFIPKLAS